MNIDMFANEHDGRRKTTQRLRRKMKHKEQNAYVYMCMCLCMYTNQDMCIYVCIYETNGKQINA